MAPKAGGEAKGPIADAIKKSFGDFAAFKKQFSEAAAGHFGSGWAWLIRDREGALKVIATHDADSPIKHGDRPLLTCDVWEHAYYIDYRNARPKYIEAFWNLVNWDFVNQNLKLVAGSPSVSPEHRAKGSVTRPLRSLRIASSRFEAPDHRWSGASFSDQLEVFQTEHRSDIFHSPIALRCV